MSGKPESGDFDDDEDDVGSDDETLDVDDLMRDIDKRKRAVANASEPAWRRLERMLEQKQMSELLDDFDDYDIGDAPRRPGR
jgi:hypothetical protein